MSRHDDGVRLRHRLEHARETTALVQACRREDLDLDRKLNLALVRLLEVVGEAAARVSPATQRASRAFRGPRSSACATG